MLFLIFGVFLVASLIASYRLKSKFKKYSTIPTEGYITGREVAERMLSHYGLHDVSVVSTPGSLTDHYNPATKTVNLSEDVYNSNSVAAAAVAAHECGHAVQHAHAYSWLQMRTALVPIQNISSTVINFIFIAMFIGSFALGNVISMNIALPIIIAAYSVFTLFSFITLPVEIDASRRALAWIDGAGVTSRETHPKAQEALRLAAYTYVIAALSSLATLLYYILQYVGLNND